MNPDPYSKRHLHRNSNRTGDGLVVHSAEGSAEDPAWVPNTLTRWFTTACSSNFRRPAPPPPPRAPTLRCAHLHTTK